MKTLNFVLVAICITFVSFISSAQNSGIYIGNGTHFTFSKGAEEWSDPVKVDLKTADGSQSIPIQIRIKFKKRMILACHYYVEITNLSDTKSVKLSFGNSYTDATGKRIWHKIKLKAKGLTEEKIIYGAGGFKPKGADDCVGCSWELEFVDVKIK
jgi:hypothetical protein